MKIKKVCMPESGETSLAVLHDDTWVVIRRLLNIHRDDNSPAAALLRVACDDLILFLQQRENIEEKLFELIKRGIPANDISLVEVIPFKPCLYRDFMLNSIHLENSPRGFYKTFAPEKYKEIEEAEAQGKKKSLSNPLFYEKPLYYKGNHLSFVGGGHEVAYPAYAKYMDYELEIGMIITKGLLNATDEEAKEAIGAFCIFNDFSVRNVQMDEMNCGFGPSKAKDFASSISNIVVTADEMWPVLQGAQTRVIINDKQVAAGVVDFVFPLEHAVAYASMGERICPGEFMGSGTIGNCTGVENSHFLSCGDVIRLEVEHLGELTNPIANELI